MAAEDIELFPAMTGSSYQDLELTEGSQASREFVHVTFGDLAPAERARVRRELERYCALDTLGMARIVEELTKATRIDPPS